MRKVRVAPKGMGLNDFVAQEEGFFAAEGIEVEWDIKTFRGTQSSWKGSNYLQRPQDKPYTEAKDGSLIQCACVWGTISNAGAGMGRFVGDCYGVSPWGIFVRPDSKIRRPEDLKNVEISVDAPSGTHQSVLKRSSMILRRPSCSAIAICGGSKLAASTSPSSSALSRVPKPPVLTVLMLASGRYFSSRYGTLK